MASADKKNDIKVTLTMSMEQAQLLAAACEFYARIHMGQWREIINSCLDIARDDFCEARDQIEPLLNQARQIVWPELQHPGASWGIGKFEDADIVWEIYEVLRHAIAWHREPKGGRGVDFYRPMSFSGRALANCKIEQIKKQRKG